MSNFSLNLPPSSDTQWYTPIIDDQKTFPLFYPLNQPPHQNDDESDNTSTNNPNRSETTSTHSQSIENHEHMFEKPLTPSDVGKLNRLVIPKQHAEKYFPLAGVSTVVTTTAEGGGSGGGGGVILGFEDESGKCWRFRYSYWNSSQSYVLTKGWSRYVKEKKLDAGDVVLFERHRFEPERFFIGWRRRGSGLLPVREDRWTGVGGGGSQRSSFYNAVQVRQGYPVPQSHRIITTSNSLPYQTTHCFHAGAEIRQQQLQTQKPASGNSKTLRLFGVDLECQLDDVTTEPDTEPQTSDGSSLSSQGPIHGSVFGSGSGSVVVGPTGYNNYFEGYQYHHHPPSSHHHHHNHMDINFPQDHVNQMRNRLG